MLSDAHPQVQTHRSRPPKSAGLVPERRKPLVDFSVIGAELRRLPFSRFPIPLAALVFNSALLGPEEPDFESVDFRRLLHLAWVVARRFSSCPADDVRVLTAMVQYSSPPHVGQAALLQALLADSTHLDFADLLTVSRRFPALFQAYVGSRLWSNPGVLCPARRPIRSPTIASLTSCGCPPDFVRIALQVSFGQAVEFFREAGTRSELLPALTGFLIDRPRYFPALSALYPNSPDLTTFVRTVINHDPDRFFGCLFDAFPKGLVALVAKILQRDPAPLRRYLETVQQNIAEVLSLLVTWGFGSCVACINRHRSAELVVAAAELMQRDRAAFLKFAAKCDDPRLDDVVAVVPPLYRAPDDVIRVVLDRPHLCHDAFTRDQRVFVDLLTHKRRFAAQIAAAIRNNREFFTPDVHDAFCELSPDLFAQCVPDDEREHCYRELLRRAFAGGPLPSDGVFVQICNGLQPVDLTRMLGANMQAILSNKRWLRPLARSPKFLAAMFLAAEHEPARAPEARGFLRELVAEFLVAPGCRIQTDFGEFSQMAEMLLHGRFIQFADLSLVSQVDIFAAFAGHCRHANQPHERGILFSLLKEFGRTTIIEAADTQTRLLIFRNLVVNIFSRRGIEQVDPGFRNMTWLLFELANDPFAEQPMQGRGRQAFLEFTAMNAGDVQEVLIERPRSRTKWLKAVLAMSRDEQFAPFFGPPHPHPIFAALLVNVIALALGSPEVFDWTGDVHLLEYFLRLLEPADGLLITKGFLKVVTSKMKGKSDRVSELFGIIFTQMLSPRLIRSLLDAIMEAGPERER